MEAESTDCTGTTTEVQQVPTTVVVDNTVPETVFDTALTTVQAPATITENSVVEVTWADATTVNPATNQVPAVSLSAYDVQPGQTVMVSVTGFTPGEQLQVWMHSDPCCSVKRQSIPLVRGISP